MTGYVRVDTSNNIADGNVISAADLDNEFDGVQAGFNASTGHTHGGTAGEGAPITKIGPTQDVTASASLLAPKTTNTVDVGSSLLKFKDLWLAGNASVAGTTTLSAALTYGGVTLSNAVTGTGNMVLSTSPTLVTPVLGTPASGVVTNLTGTASININGTVGATTANTGNFTTLTTSSTVTLNGGTANGVAYLNGSKVLTSGSALTFDGSNLTLTGNLNMTGGSIAFDDERFVYSYAGGSVGQYMSGTYYDGSGLTQRFFINNAEQMRLTSTGLGIGTSTANAKLTVQQDAADALFIKSAASNYSSLSLGISVSSGITYLQSTNSGTGGQLPFAFYIGGSEGMRLTSTGLGIGTSSPTTKLDVAGVVRATGAGPSLISVEGSGQLYAAAQLQATSSGGKNWSLVSNATSSPLGAAGSLSFRDSSVGTTHMTLDSSGNLGIGTSSPTQKLDVNGNISLSGNGTNARYVLLGNETNTYAGTLNLQAGGGSAAYGGGVTMYGHSHATYPGAVWIGYSAGTSTGILFGRGGNGVFDEQMRLTDTGLGIGTSSPGQKLHVAGNAQVKPATGTDAVWNRASNDSGEFYLGIDNSAGSGFTGTPYARFLYSTGAYPLNFYTNGAERMRLDTSGNLGLGVTPSASTYGKALEIGSAGNEILSAANDFYVSTNAYFNSGWKYGTSTFASQYNQTAGSHRWYTAPSGTAGNAISFTQAMTLDASGNLGVGLTSPSQRLSVGGNMAFHQSSNLTTTTGYLNIAPSSTLILDTGDTVQIRTSGTERARIDSSGNLIQTVNTTAATLTTNQTLTFSIVNDSLLRISVRGSDGTTRTATLALA